MAMAWLVSTNVCTSETATPGLLLESAQMNLMGWPLIPPEALT